MSESMAMQTPVGWLGVRVVDGRVQEVRWLLAHEA